MKIIKTLQNEQCALVKTILKSTLMSMVDYFTGV